MLKLVIDNTKPKIGDVVQIDIGADIMSGVIFGRHSGMYRVGLANGATVFVDAIAIVNNITQQTIKD